jgi:hypothetical protein
MLTDLERSERDISVRYFIATGADLKRCIGELHGAESMLSASDRADAMQAKPLVGRSCGALNLGTAGATVTPHECEPP